MGIKTGWIAFVLVLTACSGMGKPADGLDDQAGIGQPAQDLSQMPDSQNGQQPQSQQTGQGQAGQPGQNPNNPANNPANPTASTPVDPNNPGPTPGGSTPVTPTSPTATAPSQAAADNQQPPAAAAPSTPATNPPPPAPSTDNLGLQGSPTPDPGTATIPIMAGPLPSAQAPTGSQPAPGAAAPAPSTPAPSAPPAQASQPPPSTLPPVAGCGSMTGVACDIFNQINTQRTQNGLKPLKPFSNCIAAAQAESQDMANNNFFSHDSPTHGSFSSRAQAFNLLPSGSGSSGENIAYQTGKSDQVIVNMWMNSPGHRANILNTSYHSTGVGYSRSSSGKGYYTQCFSSEI